MSISFINPEHYWSVENYGTIPKIDPIMMSKDEKRAMSITGNINNFEKSKI